jgi:hypothetical protein
VYAMPRKAVLVLPEDSASQCSAGNTDFSSQLIYKAISRLENIVNLSKQVYARCKLQLSRERCVVPRFTKMVHFEVTGGCRE